MLTRRSLSIESIIGGGDEIYLTEEIYTTPGVPELLQAHQRKIESIAIPLKGIDRPVKIYKVTSLD